MEEIVKVEADGCQHYHLIQDGEVINVFTKTELEAEPKVEIKPLSIARGKYQAITQPKITTDVETSAGKT